MQTLELLKRADEIAHQFISLDPTVNYQVAQTAAEREATYRLRYDEIIARRWATPDSMPDQMERDEYDADAVQVVAYQAAALAGITRLVFPSPARLLPTEAAYDIRIDPVGQVVDLGRAIVVPLYRDPRHHKIFLGLLGKSWLEIRARGYSELCFALSSFALNLYTKLGIAVDTLGESRLYGGEARLPYRLNIVKTIEHLSAKTSAS
jgi:N-acyl-L-homoserine lactone synthetase